MKRVRLSRIAETDLDEIWLYVAGDGGVDVANQPNAGRLRDELAIGLRSFPVENHIIYYRPEPSHILIARVLHGRRDQASTLGPQEEG